MRLVPVSSAIQQKLPGAMLAMGYAIEGPNSTGYYRILGPELTEPVYTTGLQPLVDPQGNVIYQPAIKTVTSKPTRNRHWFGLLVLILIIYWAFSS